MPTRWGRNSPSRRSTSRTRSTKSSPADSRSSELEAVEGTLAASYLQARTMLEPSAASCGRLVSYLERKWPTRNAPDDFALIATDSRSCGGIFDVDAKRDRLTELEARMGEPGFWDNQQAAQGVVLQVKTLRGWIEPFDALDSRVTSGLELEEMLVSDHDDAMASELDAELAMIDRDLEAFRL